MTRKPRHQLNAELLAAVRANQNATDQMDDAAARGMGVNRTDARCLDLVEQFGPITAGRLAAAAGLTSGTATAVIDRLVAKGYLRRVADPSDRRRVMVEITAKLEQRAGRYYGPLAEAAPAFLARFTNAELELIAGFLRSSTEIVEKRAAEIREELG